MSDVSTTRAAVIFRVKWRVVIRWWYLCLWSWFWLVSFALMWLVVKTFDNNYQMRVDTIGHLHDDVIWLQVPECFEASYCIRYFFFCEESLVRDTSLHHKHHEMHSGSCSQMTTSCKSPIEKWREVKRGPQVPHFKSNSQIKYSVDLSLKKNYLRNCCCKNVCRISL